jgi:hypothetical protein
MPESQKVIIHIGQTKTATTSLQRAMAENSDALLKQGILYPLQGYKSTAHHEFSRAYRGVKRGSGVAGWMNSILPSRISNSPVTQDTLHQFDESVCSRMLISSELFENSLPYEIRELRRDMGRFDTQVVYVVRGRLAWLNSLYAEVVKKAMYLRPFEILINGPADRFAMSVEQRLDTRTFLLPWLAQFKENFTLLDMMQGNITDQFLDVCGIVETPRIKETLSLRRNSSANPYSIELLRKFYVSQQVRKLDYDSATRFTQRVDRMLLASDYSRPNCRTFLSTEEQARTFSERFGGDDMYLSDSYGFSRNDYSGTLDEYFDTEYAEMLYQKFHIEMLDLYHEIIPLANLQN